jgi:hypothetical protein
VRGKRRSQRVVCRQNWPYWDCGLYSYILMDRICVAAGKTASLGTPGSVIGKEGGCGLYSYISGVVEGDSADPELLATIAW